MKTWQWIRPPRLRSACAVATLLIAVFSLLPAQRPQQVRWNLGVAAAASPVNGHSFLPIPRGHWGPWSIEVSPYPFCTGAAAGYAHALPMFKHRATVSLDATAYFSHYNSLYHQTFLRWQFFPNRDEAGVLVGPSIYFLKRVRAQGLLGVGYEMPYGKRALNEFPGVSQFLEKAAVSLEVTLFKPFAE